MENLYDINYVLKKSYEYLDKITPLSCDCGRLCTEKCCKGNEKDGMLLFPGEKERYYGKENFVVYKDESSGFYAVRCKGICNRKERPLACRMFPYFPYLKTEKGSRRFVIAPDIRALNYCPLIDKKIKAQPAFLRSLRITAAVMGRNAEFCRYLEELTFLLTDFGKI